MTEKSKQAKKATQHSKSSKGPALPEEDSDTVIKSAAEASESISVSPQTEAAEVPVEFQQAPVVDTSVAQAAETETAPRSTRTDAAKANIKEGLRLHQIAGRPTKAQLILVFGQKGYLLTWPKRTERFGITPETFQAALAKGAAAVPLAPVAKPTVEKPKEKA